MNGWIGVDLDGTLAHYDHWEGPTKIGVPIAPMVARVKGWLAAGKDVRIFTARVSHDGSPSRVKDAMFASYAIMEWCERHIGQVLPITNIKDYAMTELWDDRAIHVVHNIGTTLEETFVMIPADQCQVPK